jgi:hypothetical protein
MKNKLILALSTTAFILAGCADTNVVVEDNIEIDTVISSDHDVTTSDASIADVKTSDVTTSDIKTPEITDDIENNTVFESEIESQLESEPQEMMYYTTLTDEIKERITGKSYPASGDNIQISYDDLSYLHVLYYDFDNNIQEGELICNKEIAQDLLEIFTELYNNQYQIEKIRLVDDYNADDEASMADNNTSCFNYRVIAGTDRISNHSYGKAIDINPLYNPYITTRNGTENISPSNATPYADRTASFDHKIDTEDLCYKLFIQHGFTWGGAWENSKDYQHFEKK